MRTYIIGLLTVVLVLTAMTWWAFAPQLQPQINERAEQYGFEPVFVGPEDQYVTWSKTIQPEDFMADTNVTESYSMSGKLQVLNADQFPGYASASLQVITISWANMVAFDLSDASTTHDWPEGTVPDGKTVGEDGWVYHIDIDYLPWYNLSETGSRWIWVSWETEASFSCVADHSHIDRTEATNVHMGSDAGPTHSNERYFSDEWEASDGQTVTFSFDWETGSATLTPIPGMEEDATPPPDTLLVFRATLHKSVSGETQYGTWADMECSNIDLNLDGIEEEWNHAGYWSIGNANSLELWAKTGDGSANADWENDVAPPYVIDWSDMGIADWQQVNHNSRYDDVWVEGPFTHCQYLNVDWYPGTSPGDSSAVKLGDLHSVSPYTQVVAPYSGWDMESGYEYEFFSGPYLWLKVKDCDENRAQNIPEEVIGQYIIIGVPDLTYSDCSSDPVFLLQPEHISVDVDLSGNLGERASAWNGTKSGGGQGTTTDFTVDGGDTITRNLIDPWYGRCSYYIEQEAWARFPVAYFHHENNTYSGGDGWEDANHDVYWWSSHRYLDIAASPDQSVGSVTAQVEIQYQVESVSDNHLTGTDRSVSVGLGETKTQSYTVEYDGGHFYVDLWNSDRPRFHHVKTIKITFPEGAVWTVGGVDLVLDNGNAPGRDEPPYHNLVTFHEVRHAYSAGGARAVVDGKCREVLCSAGNYNVWSGHEYLVEGINWLFGSGTGTDLSAAWGLEQYLSIMGYCCEGWNWNLPDNWGNMTVDDNGETLTTGWSFDLAERQDDNIKYDYPARFACYRWGAVRGILYRPYGVIVVQGGVHGLSNERNGSGGDIFRRGGSEGTWIDLGGVSIDVHGYWAHGYDVVYSYDNDSPIYWKYRVDYEGESYIFNRLYQRQWEWAYLLFLEGEIDAMMDKHGYVWEAYTMGNKIFVRRLDSMVEWRDPIEVTDSDTRGSYSQPAISPDPRGMVRISAIKSGESTPTTFISFDSCENWERMDQVNV